MEMDDDVVTLNSWTMTKSHVRIYTFFFSTILVADIKYSTTQRAYFFPFFSLNEDRGV